MDTQLSGHVRDAGAATGSQAGANPPDGAAAPTGTMAGQRWRRWGSAGSRGLPPAAHTLPGEISPRFHHPLPALKKFLLRARGSSHPSRAGAQQGPRWPRTPGCAHSPPPCARACRTRATCALRVHGTSWQSRAATASGSAPQRWGQPEPRQGVLEGPQEPTLLCPPRPHTHLSPPCAHLCPHPRHGHSQPCCSTLFAAPVYPSPRIHFKFLSSVPPSAPSTSITAEAVSR